MVVPAKIKFVGILKIAPKPKTLFVATDVDDATHRRRGTDEAKIARSLEGDLTFGPAGGRDDAEGRVGSENCFDFRTVGVDRGLQLFKSGRFADDFGEFRLGGERATDEAEKRGEKERY